ncbi:MAG: helix-hairpin-helix domain-containing protein [Prevotella sp.]|nr:helix-hairpin-helix domain-containing protein [Prevotella sp.]
MNRNDRRIAIAALLVAGLALVVIWLLDTPEGLPEGVASSADSLDSTRRLSSRPSSFSHPSSYSHSSVGYDATPSRTPETFPFDPNTADSTQLLRLGLTPWQVRNIYKYRARGGIYRSKEDFAQLYGLTVKDYRRLEPYIRISSDYQPASSLVGKGEKLQNDTLQRPIKIDETQHVVLNTADTTQLMRVPGIGVYYAKEIIRHGKWLGGYVSVDQLDEIDGFPQGAKKYFVVDQPSPRRLNVNKLSLNELKRHPYINYYQAKTIVDYRRLHGPLKSLDDLRLSRDFPPEVISRLKPYVEF